MGTMCMKQQWVCGCERKAVHAMCQGLCQSNAIFFCTANSLFQVSCFLVVVSHQWTPSSGKKANLPNLNLSRTRLFNASPCPAAQCCCGICCMLAFDALVHMPVMLGVLRRTC